MMATMIRNTTKPITFWFYDRISARYLIDMMIALRGSDKAAEKFPCSVIPDEPISPLRFPFHGIDLLFETARINLPVHIGPMAQMELSAPCTLAATMAQENAEMAGICITQLVPTRNAGLLWRYTPCLRYADHAVDLFRSRAGHIWSSDDTDGQVIRSTGIRQPWNDRFQTGRCAGRDRSGSHSGSWGGSGRGYLRSPWISGVDQGASLDMLTFQNEMISYVESVMREPDFSDEAFGLDEIEGAGPGGLISTDTLQPSISAGSCGSQASLTGTTTRNGLMTAHSVWKTGAGKAGKKSLEPMSPNRSQKNLTGYWKR